MRPNFSTCNYIWVIKSQKSFYWYERDGFNYVTYLKMYSVKWLSYSIIHVFAIFCHCLLWVLNSEIKIFYLILNKACYICTSIINMFYIFSGAEFHQKYGRLADIRSICPDQVTFVTLISTATKSVKVKILENN